ncbi:MAG: protease complex subunit PrcB family protein [Bacteroidetes bacterium]|nr:MAG: protease complex subunit PrcB family protein [Bacteroidota bacterium]
MNNLSLHILWILLTVCGSAMSCKSSQKTGVTPAAEGEPIAFEVLDEGAYCGVNEQKQVLIRSAAAWQQLWQDLHAGQTGGAELPEVNFDEKWVIACFMGSRNSGGYRVQLRNVWRQADHIAVSLTHEAPGKNCMATMAITQPYILVVIDRQPVDKIQFDIQEVKVDC